MILIIFLLSRTTTISAISPFAGHYRFKTNSKGWFDLWPDTFNYITSISIIRPKLFFVATLTKSHIITEIIGMIYRVLHIEDHFKLKYYIQWRNLTCTVHPIHLDFDTFLLELVTKLEQFLCLEGYQLHHHQLFSASF